MSAYMDDLVVFSREWTQHLEHVNETLTRLAAAGLTVKLAKCQFAMTVSVSGSCC